MSSIKDKLKTQAKAKLSVTAKVPEIKEALPVSELQQITYQIKSDLDELREIQEWWENKKGRVVEIKKNVMERLIFVRDNKKKLLAGRSFEDYLVNEVGVSKGYFYDNVRALEIAKEHNKPDLLAGIDPKALLLADSIEDPEVKKAVIGRAGELSREDVKALKEMGDISAEVVENYVPISQRDFIVKRSKTSITITTSQSDILDRIEKYTNSLK